MNFGIRDPLLFPGSDPMKTGFAHPGTSNPKPEEKWPTVKKGGGGGGGGRPKQKPPPIEEPQETFLPEPEPAPNPEKAAVRLSNLKWSAKEAYFDEKLAFSLDIELPESLKEITRVVVALYALHPRDKREQIGTKEFHAKDGRVSGELDLKRPEKWDGKKEESCPYIFSAKHRDSREAESEKLHVSNPTGEELLLELGDASWPMSKDYTFELRSGDESYSHKARIMDGNEKDKARMVKFINVPTKGVFSLDILDPDGRTVVSVFKDRPFGQWQAPE